MSVGGLQRDRRILNQSPLLNHRSQHFLFGFADVTLPIAKLCHCLTGRHLHSVDPPFPIKHSWQIHPVVKPRPRLAARSSQRHITETPSAHIAQYNGDRWVTVELLRTYVLIVTVYIHTYMCVLYQTTSRLSTAVVHSTIGISLGITRPAILATSATTIKRPRRTIMLIFCVPLHLP